MFVIIGEVYAGRALVEKEKAHSPVVLTAAGTMGGTGHVSAASANSLQMRYTRRMPSCCVPQATTSGRDLEALVAQRYQLRRVQTHDIPRVAQLCYEAFKDCERGFLSPAAQSLDQWQVQFTRALNAKERARKEFHYLSIDDRVRLKETLAVNTDPRRSRQMRYTGPDGKPRRPLPRILRKLQVLVVEERSSKEVVACASLSMARCESALPPPFPTSKPYRCYASNIVVDEDHRREGLASLLVNRCELLARAWGESSLWLHVEMDNEAAVSLYDKLSYVPMEYFALYGNGKTELRSKKLPKWPQSDRPPPQASLGGVNDDKVFIWK